ncbi:MAG: hypothetical protein ABII82_18505 [Verrucomicrobiota bacterium]
MPPVVHSVSSDTPHRDRRRAGFALLITITLVAFLVLILVSIATLTRVETQVAANSQQLAQARQNALLALNVALGELQKHAGPDQRTTARADLQNGSEVPHARWTGVYGSAVPADYDQLPSEVRTGLIAPANLDSATGSPARLLTWLVSGNENGVFDPASHVGASGEITPTASTLTTGLKFQPDIAMSGLSSAATTETALTIIDADGVEHDAALLVGPGSVRSAVSAGHALDYVAAPLVTIETPGSTLPGFSAGDSTPREIGRYAWWIGDEGVKARVNLPLETDPARKPDAFAHSRRAAVELMDATSPDFPAPPLDAARIGAAYDLERSVENILSAPQLTFIGPDDDARKLRFHDLTASSSSVLADTYAGGLKRDLSALLDSAHVALATDPDADLKPLHVSEDGDLFGIPTWRHLRSFADITVPVDSSDPDAGKLTPRLPRYNRTDGTPDDVGVAPVLTYAALGFRYAAAAAPAEGVAINFNVYPLVVLWNPYNARLKGTTYEFGMGHAGSATRVQLQMEDPALLDPDPAASQEAAWLVKETRDLRYAGLQLTANQNTDRPVRYFRFLVKCPDLEPGESVVFTLPASTAYDPAVATLEPGLNQTTFASMPGSTFAAGESTRRFRFVSSADRMKTHFNTGANSGANFRQGGNSGQTYAYLGVPRTTAPSITSSTQWWTPSENQWYQSIQRAGHDSNTVTNPLQDAAPLTAPTGFDEPALKWFVTTVFSSTGSNRTANKGTVPWIRWIAQSNIRAPVAFRTLRDLNYSASYIAQVGTDAAMWPTWFSTDAPGDRASAGLGHDWDTTTNQPVNATLFEFRRADQALFSVGALQHANLSLVGSYPAYPLGNAIADFRLPDLAQIHSQSSVFTTSHTVGTRLLTTYYDVSWLLNRSLWDAYYFSTVPATGTILDPLPNPRHVPHDDTKDRRDPAEAAAALMLAGGFNINSTSEQAWRAILGGINQLAYDPVAATDGAVPGAPLPRFARPTADPTLPTGISATAGTDLSALWQGYRALSEAQIAQLARNLVTEIRARGPFVSLADFVNRRLVDNPDTVADERLKGALQAAIDATPQASPGGFPINDASPGTYWDVAERVTSIFYTDNASHYSLPAARGDTTAASPGAHQTRAAFAPKFLTQADVLSAVGAGLAARSDTFLIRTYGEAINPVTGETTGRAWCEAVAQRLPAYVDAATDEPEDAASTDVNRHFGRQFKIISFRWLSPSDI